MITLENALINGAMLKCSSLLLDAHSKMANLKYEMSKLLVRPVDETIGRLDKWLYNKSNDLWYLGTYGYDND